VDVVQSNYLRRLVSLLKTSSRQDIQDTVICRRTNAQQWDMAETNAKPGPYTEIVESDMYVFMRCNV